MVWQIGQRLQQPLTLNLTNFKLHYEKRLALPFPVLLNLDSKNIARFEEQCTGLPGVDLQVQSTRFYTDGTTAAHLAGHLQRDDSEPWKARRRVFLIGCRITAGSSASKRATTDNYAVWPGPSRLQVNNIGYRTMENVWSLLGLARTLC